MLRYIAREYFYKTILSVRFLLFIVVLFISVYSLFHSMAVRLAEGGYEVGALEILPCFVFWPANIAIYFVFFVFMILVYPIWDGALNQIARLGKRKWIFIQYAYISITAVLYYLIWTAGFIIAFFPCLTWKNEWSSFFHLATAVDAEKVELFYDFAANVNMVYSANLMKLASPLMVWLLTFFLHILGSVFVGMVAVIFNICFRRGTGTILAFFIAGARGFFEGIEYLLDSSFFSIKYVRQIQEIFLKIKYFISPLYQSDLSIMAQSAEKSLKEGVRAAVVYYLFLIVLLLFFQNFTIKRVDFTQE